jgi:hypothetical protein
MNAGIDIEGGCFAVNGTCVGAVGPTGPAGPAGSGVGTWATTTSQVSGRLVNYPYPNDTDIVAIGANSTTTSEFWFDPNISRGYISGSLTIAGTASSTATAPLANTLYADNITKGWLVVRVNAGTPVIAQSFNVSSITDTATGRFTINWLKSFADTYALAGSAEGTTCGTGTDNCYVSASNNDIPAVGSVEVQISDDASAEIDAAWWSVMAIGRQT